MVEAPLHPYCLGETDGGGSGKKSLARPPTDGTEHCRAGTSLGTPPKEEEEEEGGREEGSQHPGVPHQPLPRTPGWAAQGPPPQPPGPPLTCREWALGSGGLKKESGSFLSRMGSVCGTLAPLGFMTALKSASRSVSESPRTWTI